MAAPLTVDLHYTLSSSEPKPTPNIFFSKQNPPRRRNHANIFCRSSSSKSPPKKTQKSSSSSPSLADQLKPLSATTMLPEDPQNSQGELLTKPIMSTWVNPSRPKPSFLSLQRQKRASFTAVPQFMDLKMFCNEINNAEFVTEEGFVSLLKKIPYPVTKDSALLVLNYVKTWQKTLAFFNWVKTQEFFPVDTIMYNVVMKSLRAGRQFEIIEKLANEMIEDDVELDNITYSTIISCANKSSKYDKALDWFERMYKVGVIPDEVTYSVILDVFGRVGRTEEVMGFYERARASGWTPDVVAFSVLCKVFGDAGDYDGIMFVLQEMKTLGVRPNLIVYNTLLQALGRAGKPGIVKTVFKQMIESGVTPDVRTLTAVAKVYGKYRWGRDALELWQQMHSNGWPVDYMLFNTLLSMCADVGYMEEAEVLFEEMKRSQHCGPDSYSYTAMLNIYCSAGKVDRAMELFEEMSKESIELNIMGCTCLIQGLGRSKRIDELVKVFEVSVQTGIKPDDRLCACLLSVLSLCDNREDAEKVIGCLKQANPRLVAFVGTMSVEQTSFEALKEELRAVLSYTEVEVRKVWCNNFIDICRNRNLLERAHEILRIGISFGLYPKLHLKTAGEWTLDVRSLSVGAAQTALEDWMTSLTEIVKRQETLPRSLAAYAGAGAHKFSQGLKGALAAELEKMGAPFRLCKERRGYYVATQDDFLSWAQSRG